jgi:hypothetical protein
MVAPIVTGTFGGSDFMHSMLGEAQDHLSQASVSDLYGAVNQAKAKSRGNNPVGDLVGLLSKVPGGASNPMTRDAEDLSRGPGQDVTTMSPQEIYKNLFRILTFRDNCMMWIEQTIEKIPGLSSLVEKISNSISVFVLTLIEPYVQPLVKQALGGLQMGSSEVINQEDQFEVFNNPNASDPTHSMLSKDHFGLVLNELAGKVAVLIVRHCTTLVVKAWDDDSIDPSRTADEALAPIFHPFWLDQHRCHPVQLQMMELVKEWASANRGAIAKLDRQHVRAHKNTRSGLAEPHGHGGNSSSHYGGVQPHGQQGQSMGTGMAHSVQSYVGGRIQGAVGGHGMGQGMFREVQDGPPEYPGQSVHQNHNQPHHAAHQREDMSYMAPQGNYGSNDPSSAYSSQQQQQQQQQGAYPGYPQQQQGGYPAFPQQQQSEYPYNPAGPPPGMPMENPRYGGPPQPPHGYGGYPNNY